MMSQNTRPGEQVRCIETEGGGSVWEVREGRILTFRSWYNPHRTNFFTHETKSYIYRIACFENVRESDDILEHATGL